MPISIEEFKNKTELELYVYGRSTALILNLLRESRQAWTIKELQDRLKKNCTSALARLISQNLITKRGSYYAYKEGVVKK